MITKKQIYEIIRDDVCGMCRKDILADLVDSVCRLHQVRCHEAYNRQAEKIMEAIEKDGK